MPEEYQPVNVRTDNVSSETESSQDYSDNSDNDKAMEDGNSGEESEDALKSAGRIISLTSYF